MRVAIENATRTMHGAIVASLRAALHKDAADFVENDLPRYLTTNEGTEGEEHVRHAAPALFDACRAVLRDLNLPELWGDLVRDGTIPWDDLGAGGIEESTIDTLKNATDAARGLA